MPANTRMACAMVVAFISGVLGPTGSVTAQPLGALIAELDRWIDANSNLPAAPYPPAIRYAKASTVEEEQHAAMSNGVRTRGLYDPETRTITLIDPWDPSNLEDVSVLLHEIVHHRQPGVREHCPSSQEPQAYRLQDEWLAARGLDLDVSWIAIELTSGCGLHDVHPD